MGDRRVFVRAAKDREVPLHPSNVAGAGGTFVKILGRTENPDGTVKTEGLTYAVLYNTETRKRITSGDLELVDRQGKPVAEPAAAEVQDDTFVDPDGSIPTLPTLEKRKADEEKAKAEADAAAKAEVEAKAKAEQASKPPPDLVPTKPDVFDEKGK